MRPPTRLKRGDTLTPNGVMSLICNVNVDDDKLREKKEGKHMHER